MRYSAAAARWGQPCWLWIAVGLSVLAISPSARADDVPLSPPPMGLEGPGYDCLENAQRALRGNRVREALEIVRRALKDFPDDPVVQRCYVELHVSLARKMIDWEDYDEADRLLDAALAVSRAEIAAHDLRVELVTRRAEVNERVAEALAWLEMEWFEPAFTALRQARGLAPDRKKEWVTSYLAAAIGAGDDLYFTRNFREAFQRYDAAARVIQDGEVGMEHLAPCSAAALQCLVFELGPKSAVLTFGEQHWNAILQIARLMRDAAQRRPPENRDGIRKTILLTELFLDGVTLERARDLTGALKKYQTIVSTVSKSGDLVQRFDEFAGRRDAVGARSVAIDAIRTLYSYDLSSRRTGTWQKTSSPDWQTIDGAGFRVHHRNETVGRRVSAALTFHFPKSARFFGRTPEAFQWSIPCDVYVHPDDSSFRKAVGEAAQAGPGVSSITLDGGKLRAHRIDLLQTDPMLLSSTLPHEYSHIMLAWATEYRPIPLVLREGVALHVEPECRGMQFRRLLPPRQQRRSVERLLDTADVLPADQPVFNAEAYALMARLLRRATMGDIITACAAEDVKAALPRAVYLADLNAIDTLWRGVLTTAPHSDPP
jgi:tetratricopeptide (TPR) repeat protein